MWRLRDLLAVVLLGAGVAVAVAALIGGAAVSVIRHVPFLPEARDWWIGDALGILVVAPLVLAWGRADFTEPSPVRKRPLEFAALILASLAASWAVFHEAPSGVLGETYLVLPVFVWAALRFGPRGVTATGTVLAAAGAWATAWAAQHGRNRGARARLGPGAALPRARHLDGAGPRHRGRGPEPDRAQAATGPLRARPGSGGDAGVRSGRPHRARPARPQDACSAGPSRNCWGRGSPPSTRRSRGGSRRTAWSDLRALGTTRYETVLADGAGRHPPVEVHLAFLAFDGAEFLAWSGRDLSERRRVEEDQRLAAVGTLASGVAHEINNPLTYVTSNLAFVEETLAKVRGLHPDVEEAVEAAAEAALGARKVRDIVRDLRFVARPPDGRRIEVEPVQEIRSAITLAQAEIHRRSGLELHLDPCPHVLAGQGQIGQVMIHLLLNAAQSTPAGSPSTHTVRVSSRTDEEGWAAIEVADSGSGIPAAARARIFEPFFSTRPVGGGAGLGLSVCHGIVTGLGGSIDVVSEEGRGTTVRVRLPPAG